VTTQPSSFILSLPKAELHLHLEGTVDPATLSELSQRHCTPLAADNNRYTNVEDSGRVLSEDDVRALYSYTDFVGFLMAFKAVTERLRTPEDYELITYRMMQKLAAQGVVHAEVFVSVGVLFWRGHPIDPLFEGMEAGRKRGERDFGITLYWIFDAVRNFGAEEALKVAKKAVEYRDRNVIGFGIGGDERRGAPEEFRDSYRYARQHGLRTSCHAGETTGPESISGALDALHTGRLGHALSLQEDPELLQRVVREQVPLELCIASNQRTGCCPRIEDHPVRKYFDAGAMITLNTDDPEMFQTSLAHEYQLAQDVHGFSNDELRHVAMNSIRASWLPDERKSELLKRY